MTHPVEYLAWVFPYARLSGFGRSANYSRAISIVNLMSTGAGFPRKTAVKTARLGP